jgi:hypothetical protein
LKFFKQKHFYVVKKIQSAKKIPKQLFYIKKLFSSCVIGTPVDFSGMIVRGQAVILKLNFSKSCDHKKSLLLGHSVRNWNVHPV